MMTNHEKIIPSVVTRPGHVTREHDLIWYKSYFLVIMPCMALEHIKMFAAKLEWKMLPTVLKLNILEFKEW